MALVSSPATPRPTKFCQTCGVVIDAMAGMCPSCGVLQPAPVGMNESNRRILPAFALCLTFGYFGAHRFYVGKIGTGLLQLLTVGGLGIWWMIDLIMIATGAFRDVDGERITEWT